MWSPRLVRKGSVRHSGADVSLRLVVIWQAESLKSSEITDGEARLQPVERSTLEQGTGPEKGCDSEGDLCWGGSFLGELLPVGDILMLAGGIRGGLSPVGEMPCCCRGRL